MARYTLTREFYIPTGARKVAHNHSTAVAYVYENRDRPCAMVFFGKAQKPAWRYAYTSDEKRFAAITAFFNACQAKEQATRDRRAARTARGIGLAVGDILSAQWGYDQTNVDWFEVTALIGATMVEIREICEDREETEWLQGKTVPLPGTYKGEPMRRKASGGYVRIDEVRGASKVEPLALIGGKPVFAAAHFTAYH